MQIATLIDLLDTAKLAVSDVLLSIRGCELYAVAFAERALRLPIQRHTMQPARIVAYLFAVLALHRHPIVFLVHAFHTRVFSRFDAVCFAAYCVAHHVARLVLTGPLPVRAGNLLPCYQSSHAVLAVVHLARTLHRPVDRFIDFSSGLIVGRHYQRTFGFRRILARDFS